MSPVGEIVLTKLCVFILIILMWNIPILGWIALVLAITNVADIVFAAAAACFGD